MTVDQTFSFPRKLPGARGWKYQDLRGVADAPLVGHADPEYLVYMRRVGGVQPAAHRVIGGRPEIARREPTKDRRGAELAVAVEIGGDELRANAELLDRFFPQGTLDEQAVREAAPGGSRDLAWLLTPSRGRALALDKAYWLIVQEQSFVRGRDATLAPAVHVHRAIGASATELAAAGALFLDGGLHLVWPEVQAVTDGEPR